MQKRCAGTGTPYFYENSMVITLKTAKANQIKTTNALTAKITQQISLRRSALRRLLCF